MEVRLGDALDVHKRCGQVFVEQRRADRSQWCKERLGILRGRVDDGSQPRPGFPSGSVTRPGLDDHAVQRLRPDAGVEMERFTGSAQAVRDPAA